MLRIPYICRRRGSSFVLVAWLLLATVAPVVAAAAAPEGCSIMRDPAERVDCEARAVARAEARREVERRLADSPASAVAGERASSGSAASDSKPRLNDDWQGAMREASSIDLREVLHARTVAALVGTAWFVLAVRRRWRARRRAMTL